MASEHTAKAFDSDLQELTRLVAEMGGLVERMITESVDALVRRDVALGKRVVAADVEIDRLQHLIEERAVLTIARRQPMAIDLREIVGAMRVATDLERIGDLAKNMGKRVAALENDFQPLKLIRGLEHMTDLVQSQVKSVLDAYAAHDLPAAMAVWKGDEEVDAICTSLFRELLTYMMEDPRNISFCIHLMFCAKNIERIGDHATNIAETVFYMIEGQQMLDKRPKGDMTTFATTVPATSLRDEADMSARIMVVEDEEALTTLLRYNLDAEGYDVETVGRGDDADTRLKERVPDLVVLDWMLPGLSGIELCRRLRARPETRQLPIIMLTARGEESERVRGPGDRRRRLHRQAVLGAGTAGAGEGPVAAGKPRAARHRADLWRHRTRSREAPRRAFGPLDRSRPDRVSPAGVFPGASRPRVQPRAIARQRLGPRHLYRRAHRRRAYRPPAQTAQSRPRAGPDPHRARRRLCAG